MADGPREGETLADKNSSKCCESMNVDLKTKSEVLGDIKRVKLSFYIERDVVEKDDLKKNIRAAQKRNSSTTKSDMKTDGMNRNTGTNVGDERKKRCVDRYDSSESSDSGVALTESAGSGSEITDPGSPYSPASSSGHSDDSASARLPAWACEKATSNARKRHNIELIADRLQPKRPACTTKHNTTGIVANVAAAKTAKAQQGRITEYYNHKMKPNVQTKREPSAVYPRNEQLKKKVPTKGALVSDLQKYMTYLSQTLDQKVHTEAQQPDDLAAPNVVSNVTTNAVNSFTNLINKISPLENTKSFNGIPAEADSPKSISRSGKTKTGRSLNAKKAIRRLSLPNGKGFSNSNTINKPEVAKVNGTVRLPAALPQIVSNPENSHLLNEKNNSTFEPVITNNVCTNMQTQFTYNNGFTKVSPIQEIPNAQPQCNVSINNPSNLSPYITVPQTVMLTTLRIPQNNSQTQQISTNNVNGLNRSIGIGNAIASPTKLNGQFVFPLMQNLNGTVVQFPNMVAKVGQNYVIPNATQIQQPRQDQTIQAQINQQTTQMLINGALYKISNTQLQQNYGGVVTKSSSTTNISYPIMPKSFNTGMPTVVVSKPNYGFNVGHPMYMSPSGYIINSMPTVKMCDTQQNVITSMQSHMHSFSNSQINLNTSTQHMCSEGLSSSSIPIAPVKPPDKQNEFIFSMSSNNVSSISTNTDFDANNDSVDMFCSSNTNNSDITSDENSLSNPESSSPPASIENDEQESSDSEMREICGTIDASPSNSSCSENNMMKTNPDEQCDSNLTGVKDESSEVKANVDDSSMTNDSESGIGTSIDSPSDSRSPASKDGDDDFTASLCVSVEAVESEKPQKSPILKEPMTIRFPPRVFLPKDARHKQKRDSSVTRTTCMWENCKLAFDGDSSLLEHLLSEHVTSQEGKDNFVCLWDGCKVRGRPSCSRLWLERHTLSHGGNKPFKCIVEECGRRFSTQLLLERHVNNHFNSSATSVSSARKSTETTATKHIRRNGKKLRYRRTPWSAKKCDFVDAGMVQGIKWRLHEITEWRLGGKSPLETGATSINVTAAVRARRQDPKGNTELLLTWTPAGVLDDEWVLETQAVKSREVNISSLEAQRKVHLYDSFCESYRSKVEATAANKKPLAVGAAKRKQGRTHGGNFFWPSGR